MNCESVLIVVAHPDDDVLGMGGTAYRMSRAGHTVRAAILCGSVTARTRRPADEDLRLDTLRATQVLGMEAPIFGEFPNIRMNTVDHIDLVQFVEQAILDSKADRIFTTHPQDLNDDHRQVSAATQAAARIYQRANAQKRLLSLHYMEVLSATDWAFRGGLGFQADAFVHIGDEGLDAKLRALSCYRDVMRPYPHPRSAEVISGVAASRGAQAGLEYAEAFQTAYFDLGANIL